MEKLTSDIIVIGGGLGGVASAISAASNGKKVIMTEETKWIGGQMTTQAVPPDEHPWIEMFGRTELYAEFRDRVRAYYRDNYPLTPEARKNKYLNPGNGWVSKLCHEPKVALSVLNDMLAPYVSNGRVTVLLNTKIVSAEVSGDAIQSVEVKDTVNDLSYSLTGTYYLDATEAGDVLPVANVEYVIGTEARKDTGEPHASEVEDPSDMQSFTMCFALEYIEGKDFTIEKPRAYDFWKDYAPSFWTGKLFDWTHPFPQTHEPWEKVMFREEGRPIIDSLWEFRRIVDKNNFVEGAFEGDITMVNWPQIDYWMKPIIDVSENEKEKAIEEAKQLSLSFLYWLQTEAPTQDGKKGYPGLKLRKDIVGTPDGMAMPYLRESRRIKALFTVLEQHVTPEFNPGVKAKEFKDTIGIGSYRIDLHPSTGGTHYIDIDSQPFQIPLGSLIPVRMKNLIAAGKNIGTTHVTQGCYRLHPVEWNIGESAGHLAAYCINNECTPKDVYENETLLTDYQNQLLNNGIQLEWPEVEVR